MKTTFKKSAAIILGILFGACVMSQYALAQGTMIPPGNPNVYNGESGTKVSTTLAGKFGNLEQVGQSVINFIEKVLVRLIIALALLSFLWGMLHYIKNGADSTERGQGRQFMLWGIIGLAVMVSVWGLVRILTNTLGVPQSQGIPTLPANK